MAKQRTRRTAVRQMPEPTRKLTGDELEMDKANKWFIRQPRGRRHDIRLQARKCYVTLAHAVMDAYQASLRDAGRPG